MSKVLVTGGAGFIGSHLVDRLLEENLQVRVLDDLSTGFMENLPLNHPNLEFVQGSVADAENVKAVCEGVTSVVHLAALVSVPISINEPERSAQINVTGFQNILNELRRRNFQGRFVYASSSAVYGGDDRTGPLTEKDAPGHLISPYALDKYTNELYAQLYSELYGLSALGFRFFNVYGPRQDPSSDYSGVISIFMDKASRGEHIHIYGDGGQVRDFVYVKDVAEALFAAIKSDSCGVLNLGTGSAVSINQLAEKVQGVQQSNQPIGKLPARAGDIYYSCANTDVLKEALHIVPNVSLEVGLQALKEWIDLKSDEE